VIAISFLTVLLSIVSPTFGMIFFVASGGKILIENPKVRRFIFPQILILIFVSIYLKLISLSEGLDIILTYTISLPVFFYLLMKKMDYGKSLEIFGGLTSIFVGLKFLLLKNYIIHNWEISIANIGNLMEKMNITAEQKEISQQLIASSKYIFIHYTVALTTVSFILAVYIGALVLNKKTIIKWNYSRLNFSFEIVYVLIIAIISSLFSISHYIGMNLLAILGSFFLIQGLAILNYYWGGFMRRSKVFTFFLILTLIFNPYVLLLIALIGLMDMWFDIRKIREVEESNEDNPN
jgi:hypothetical protein